MRLNFSLVSEFMLSFFGLGLLTTHFAPKEGDCLVSMLAVPGILGRRFLACLILLGSLLSTSCDPGYKSAQSDAPRAPGLQLGDPSAHALGADMGVEEAPIEDLSADQEAALRSALEHVLSGGGLLNGDGAEIVLQRITSVSSGFIGESQLRAELNAEQFSEVLDLIKLLEPTNRNRFELRGISRGLGVIESTSTLSFSSYRELERVHHFVGSVEPWVLTELEDWERDLDGSRGVVSFWAPSISGDSSRALVRCSAFQDGRSTTYTLYLRRLNSVDYRVFWTHEAVYF